MLKHILKKTSDLCFFGEEQTVKRNKETMNPQWPVLKAGCFSF
jgi:hypothetical protein